MLTEVLLDPDALLDAAANALAGNPGFLLGRTLAGTAVVSRVLPDPRKKGFAEGLSGAGHDLLGRFLTAARPPRDTKGWVTGQVALLGRRGTARRQAGLQESKGGLEGDIGRNGFRLEAWVLVWTGPAHQRTWKKIPLHCPQETGNPRPPAPPAPTPLPPAVASHPRDTRKK